MATRSSKTTPKTTTRKTSTSATKAKATTPRKTTTAKSTAKTAPKTAPVAATPTAPATPTPVVTAPTPVVSGPTMRKRELVDAVVKKSGVKKKDAKPVVEAMLHVLGTALQDGRELNLQPFGKVKINRERKLPEGKVIIARIRQARDLPTTEHSDPEPEAKATAAE